MPTYRRQQTRAKSSPSPLRLAAHANSVVEMSRTPCMLLSHDVAVKKKAKVTSAPHSSCYRCNPDVLHKGTSRASTTFGVPQPGSQYSSTAGLTVIPVQFSILKCRDLRHIQHARLIFRSIRDNTAELVSKFASRRDLSWSFHCN